MKTLRTQTSQKSFIKTSCYNNKVINKVTKRLQKLSNKKNVLHPSNIISNSTKYNLSNSFHGQTSLRNTIFSVMISEVKLSQFIIVLRNAHGYLVVYFLSCITLFISLFPETLQWVIPEKIQTRWGWGYGIYRGIKEIAYEIPRGLIKKKRISKGWPRKNNVEIPGVYFWPWNFQGI